MEKKSINVRWAFFFSEMVQDMVESHNVEGVMAVKLALKHMTSIDVTDEGVQHLGADYFAKQILMDEGIIPFKPM